MKTIFSKTVRVPMLCGSLLALAVLTVQATPTNIPLKVVASGGKVIITTADGKRLDPVKGTTIPVGSTISTGPNSWVDVSQGGLSAMRIKAKTQSFSILRSVVDKATQLSDTFFKLKNGSVFVTANHNALKKGSKYQIQMPDLIAGVVGSEGEMVNGPLGSTVVCAMGSFIGNGQPIPPGSMMVDPIGDSGSLISPAPSNVLAALGAVAGSMPTPTGGALDGGATGGTADGIQPPADTIGGAMDGGTGGGPPPGGGGGDEANGGGTDQNPPPAGEQNGDDEDGASPSSP